MTGCVVTSESGFLMELASCSAAVFALISMASSSVDGFEHLVDRWQLHSHTILDFEAQKCTGSQLDGFHTLQLSVQQMLRIEFYLLIDDTVASAQRWCRCIMSRTLRILRAYSGQIPNLYLIMLPAYTDPRYEA